jgi:putative transposase
MRKPRLLLEGAWYHVTARVNRGEMLFDRDEVKELFLVLLTRAKKRYKFQVMNFCIMENHVHLMVQPAKGVSLSDIMRWLLGVFAQAYNKRRGWTGHFWGDRFHSRILAGLRQIAIAFGYIDANPVKASLVDHPWEWRHGGYWHDWTRNREVLDPSPPWIVCLSCLRKDMPRISAPY